MNLHSQKWTFVTVTDSDPFLTDLNNIVMHNDLILVPSPPQILSFKLKDTIKIWKNSLIC